MLSIKEKKNPMHDKN